MNLQVGRPDEALAEAIFRCATRGTDWLVVNSARETVWEIEADSKVDDDDLTFPAIVHMRGGHLMADSPALLVSAEEVEA